MSSTSHWSPCPGAEVVNITESKSGELLVSVAGPTVGSCPCCRQQSKHRHGWIERRLQDLPSHGRAVKIRLRLSRWRCMNPACGRRSFVAELPALAQRYARRTSRVQGIVGLLGHAAGGLPAERVMARLGMPVSDDTILRHLKRRASPKPPTSPAKVIGIDDWSWRKGWRYGTIVVDLERRQVLDVLEDRSMESTAAWLEQHPKITVISRDRCGLYAEAARKAAPQADQVADRFHLLQNLRLAIEEQMSLCGRFTGRALLPNGTDENIKEMKPLRARLNDVDQQEPARQVHQQSRQSVFAAVHALHAQGLSCSEIARRTGYGSRGIAKWLTCDAPPDRRRAEPKSTSPRRFEEFLAESWKLGVRHGRHLYLDIKKLGYTGSFSHLEKLLATWRRKEKPAGKVTPAPTPLPQLPLPGLVRIIDPATGHAISPVVAASLCIKPRGMLLEEQALRVDVLKEASPDFAAMRRLAMRFRGILRSGKAAKLNGWIEAALHSGIASMQRFARILKRDIHAVRNAIKLQWSNGQVEGQINRLKTIKRAMYGRAGPALLRARMLPVQSACSPHRK